jgi:pimeloyl-ACP methyl ester carboxylesterase
VGRTADQAAGALVALLDSLGIETCSLVAVSAGGPTGIALAARSPQRVQRLALVAAISRPETRQAEPGFESQKAFYGPMHGVMWRMLSLIGALSPRSLARQTLAIFSTHDPREALDHLSPQDIEAICRFYRGRSSRWGALNDLTHTVGEDLLQAVTAPTLVIHSREDSSVPFSHAEWSLEHLPHAALCETGFTGHFYWVGPESPQVAQHLVAFLKPGPSEPSVPKTPLSLPGRGAGGEGGSPR